MKITLDFFGFTKEMEVPQDLYDNGVIEIQAVRPLRVAMKESDMVPEPYFKRLIFYRAIGRDVFRFERVE